MNSEINSFIFPCYLHLPHQQESTQSKTIVTVHSHMPTCNNKKRLFFNGLISTDWSTGLCLQLPLKILRVKSQLKITPVSKLLHHKDNVILQISYLHVFPPKFSSSNYTCATHIFQVKIEAIRKTKSWLFAQKNFTRCDKQLLLV